MLGTDLGSDGLTFLRSYRLLRSLGKFGDGAGITSKIDLATDEDDGKTGAEMKDLGDPLRRASERGARGWGGGGNSKSKQE